MELKVAIFDGLDVTTSSSNCTLMELKEQIRVRINLFTLF